MIGLNSNGGADGGICQPREPGRGAKFVRRSTHVCPLAVDRASLGGVPAGRCDSVCRHAAAGAMDLRQPAANAITAVRRADFFALSKEFWRDRRGNHNRGAMNAINPALIAAGRFRRNVARVAHDGCCGRAGALDFRRPRGQVTNLCNERNPP